jgi:hypothetical protein
VAVENLGDPAVALRTHPRFASSGGGRETVFPDARPSYFHREIDEKHRHIAADHRKMEEQANAFAGAFLLPAQSFARDIYAVTLEALRSLKPKWKVAIGAMLKRAEAPGFISEHQVQRTWIAYSRRGWRLREPLDHELEPEQPYLLRRAFEALVQSGANVRAEVVASGLCSPRDVEILCGLPGGFLSEEGPREVPKPVVAAPRYLEVCYGSRLRRVLAVLLGVAGGTSLRGALGGTSEGGVVGSVGGTVGGAPVGAPVPGSTSRPPGGTVVLGAGADGGLPTRGSPVGGPITALGVRAGGGAFVVGA